MADGFSLRGKFSKEEEKQIKEWLDERKLSLKNKGTENQFVKHAIMDFILNNSTINPRDPPAKIRSDLEKISQRDTILRKKKRRGPKT